MLAIIDYGAGNTYNVAKAFAYLAYESQLTSDPAQIAASSALVLPGVGAFNAAYRKLQADGLVTAIKAEVAKGKPLLGICLGMQLLFDSSEEYGNTPGLGLIPGRVIPIPANNLLVPQVGWNQNKLLQEQGLFKRVKDEYTYFVHSYYAKCEQQYVVSYVDYGVKVPAIVNYQNVYGMQFHPEKSGQVGLGLLKDFMEGNGLK